MAYGVKINSFDDNIIAAANEGAVAATKIAEVGLYLVDLIPVLKYLPTWFPGTEFHKIAANGRRLSQQTLNYPYDTTVELMVTKHHTFPHSSNILAENRRIRPVIPDSCFGGDRRRN
jgi:hypothetical protein